MTLYRDDVLRDSREDLLQTLAGILGSTPDDHRIVDAYDQVVSEWTQSTADPDAAYQHFFADGAIATEADLVAIQTWAGGRVLI